MIDGAGDAVPSVAAFLKELQAWLGMYLEMGPPSRRARSEPRGEAGSATSGPESRCESSRPVRQGLSPVVSHAVTDRFFGLRTRRDLPVDLASAVVRRSSADQTGAIKRDPARGSHRSAATAEPLLCHHLDARRFTPDDPDVGRHRRRAHRHQHRPRLPKGEERRAQPTRGRDRLRPVQPLPLLRDPGGSWTSPPKGVRNTSRPLPNATLVLLIPGTAAVSNSRHPDYDANKIHTMG